MQNEQPSVSATSGRNPDFSVVVPVYNEREALPEFLTRLGAVLGAWHRSAEVVFVDDAGSDGSDLLIERFCAARPGACLIRHAVNRGRGRAILTAVDRARGAVVVTLDADLENPPEAIPLLAAALGPDTACATGFRQGRSRRNGRGLASWVYNRVMALLTGLPLHDCNCGLKAFRRDVLDQAAVRSWLEKDADYFRFLVYLLSRVGLRTTECRFPCAPRRHGKSRYGWKRYTKSIRDLLTLLLSDVRSGLFARRRHSGGKAQTPV